ncbi:hypothetical protein Tcan_02429 [Toxocara canis]|uniref:DNA ligase ATP-dependent N-terminal domain-containing protein n=1 Tax=Toxocara canis TaxID=6265 RepID=A0A0B2UQJ6_TOXCA|nr:hypothetical protein Tcan_02429 [Toxocara canis]
MEVEKVDSGFNVSRRFKFAALCEFLDRIRHVPKNGTFAKRRIFVSLMASWSSDTTNESAPKASFYPALRLITSAYDSRKFNMKSKKLIGKVCKSLLLPDQVKKELLQADSRSSTLALAKLARYIAERNPSSRDDTIFQVNESLDKIMDAELSIHLQIFVPFYA